MYCLGGEKKPWFRRLDHLICEVPDIEEAVELFLALGFPLAWPIGRFWPKGRTAGVALGGINLEFLQPDEGAPAEARIRTLAFEPFDLQLAVDKLSNLGLTMRIAEKWESEPALLRLRGFNADEAQTPQLICRNAYPSGDVPLDFFVCEYSPALGRRLAPSSFPNLTPVAQVVLGTPDPPQTWMKLAGYFGLPIKRSGPEVDISEEPNEFPEVTEIRLDRGPLDLGGWPARFRFA